MKTNWQKLKKQSAFTLIEIMAVVLIVAIGLVGTSQLVVQTLQAQTINRSTIIAYQLAQEGIELVRYIRDTNWIEGASSWDEGLERGMYCIDYRNPVLQAANGIEDCPLYQDANDWYIHPLFVSETNNPTQFRRGIVIDDSNYVGLEDHSLLVMVYIEWYENGRQYRYAMGTELFNWR
jgi:prepilin-type N-terminal cleavage/methylation domain-containing protein